jgi:hypothetical protein
MQLVLCSIDKLDSCVRQLALEGFNEPRDMRGRQRAKYANTERSVSDACPKLSLHFVASA